MAQAFGWPDPFQGAVSLTYDDGLPVHYQIAAPLLNHHGLLATFYPTIQSDLRLHPGKWQKLAEAGHELGNHTVFHPCRQSSQDPFPWLDDRYDLGSYTIAHLRAELEVANLVLHLLDGLEDRSYGSTCCDLEIGHGETKESMEPLLAEMFVAARGELTDRIVHPAARFDLYNIDCIRADDRSLEELIDIVEHARESGGWAVLMIHGIGKETHHLYLEKEIHKGFIEWVAKQNTIWVAPVRTIAYYINQHINITNFPAELY